MCNGTQEVDNLYKDLHSRCPDLNMTLSPGKSWDYIEDIAGLRPILGEVINVLSPRMGRNLLDHSRIKQSRLVFRNIFSQSLDIKETASTRVKTPARTKC